MPSSTVSAATGFRHEAMLYAGLDEFVVGTVPFLREALERDEPALVVVEEHKVAALRDALGDDAGRVHFADMDEVGRNPARIIPAWRRFVDEHGGDERSFRGIGEPVHPGRSEAELVECQLHERVINTAFDRHNRWWLLCPYDVGMLPPHVVDDAERTHPFVMEVALRRTRESDLWFQDDDHGPDAMRPLADPPAGAARMIFGAAGSLEALRPFVTQVADAAGMSRPRIDDLVLAVTELVANSIRHGGGRGMLLLWTGDDETLVGEVRDSGRFDPPPLLGRELPPPEALRGRGLWLVNQLCDLLQIRSGPLGTTMRIHMDLD